MKKTYNLLILLFLCALLSTVRGADPAGQKMGFYTFFNAVGTSTPTKLEIGKDKVKPDGFILGEMTGGIGISAGSHVFTAKNATAKHEDVQVEIKPDASTVLVAYLISGEEKPKIRFFTAPAAETSSSSPLTATVVYISGRPGLDVEVNGSTQHLKALDLVPVAVPQGSITIKHHADTIGSYGIDGSGNYLVIIFDDDKGELVSKLVPWNLYQKAK